MVDRDPLADAKDKALAFGIGVAAGAAGGVIAGRRSAEPPRMPHLEVWRRVMAGKWGEVMATVLAARVRERYEDLYVHRPRFSDRRLRWHLERNILPGLALYQVLGRHAEDKEPVLKEIEVLFAASFTRGRTFVQLLDRLPGAFGLLRLSARWQLARRFPRSGWDVRWVEDSADCVAFDIHRCFYYEVLSSYDAPLLTAAYCRMDDVVYSALPAEISWERSKTLGRGDDCCDFRFSRLASTGISRTPTGPA